MRAIKSNMVDQIGMSKKDRQILHCPQCDGEWSGHAGDYWQLPDDHVFTCKECGCELELVTKQVTTEYLQ